MKLETKAGLLTRYGLACGYVKRFESPSHFVTLEMTGSTIHVSHFNRETGKRYQGNFARIKDARKFFNKLKKDLAFHSKNS